MNIYGVIINISNTLWNFIALMYGKICICSLQWEKRKKGVLAGNKLILLKDQPTSEYRKSSLYCREHFYFIHCIINVICIYYNWFSEDQIKFQKFRRRPQSIKLNILKVILGWKLQPPQLNIVIKPATKMMKYCNKINSHVIKYCNKTSKKHY